MTVENWSENILVAALADDPTFSDDILALIEEVDKNHEADVVLDFSSVSYLNSSNIAKLLKLRKRLIGNKRRLVLAGIDTTVWGLFLVTGLDKVFEFADSVATGLAAVQIGAG